MREVVPTRMLSSAIAMARLEYVRDTKSGNGNEIMSHTNKFVIRTYHRIPVRCATYYLGGDFLGKGTIMNLCRNGFRVLGDHQVVPGMELVVRLTLPDRDEPVEIQRVVVRWVRGLLFGAKVVTMSPEGENRVGAFLSSRLRAYCASS